MSDDDDKAMTDPYDERELRRLAAKICDTEPRRLAVLPDDVLVDALNKMQTAVSLHRLNLQLYERAVRQLLAAWTRRGL